MYMSAVNPTVKIAFCPKLSKAKLLYIKSNEKLVTVALQPVFSEQQHCT